MLGGTSGLNYMLYVRGNAADFDDWASRGNIGWSFDEVTLLKHTYLVIMSIYRVPTSVTYVHKYISENTHHWGNYDCTAGLHFFRIGFYK